MTLAKAIKLTSTHDKLSSMIAWYRSKTDQAYTLAKAAEQKRGCILRVINGLSTLPVDKIRNVPINDYRYYADQAIAAWKLYDETKAHLERLELKACIVSNGVSDVARDCDADRFNKKGGAK